MNSFKNHLAAILAGLCITATAYAVPAQVLIIRHGEKPAQGPDLSAAGYARAKALVDVFATDPDFLKYGPPAVVYAMAPDGTDGTERPIETVTPLVQALSAKDAGFRFVNTFTKAKTVNAAQDVLQSASYSGKMVLMCWEHDAIADLLATFGVNPLPAPWPDSVFGRVYEVNFNADGSFKSLKCRTELAADSQDCAGF